ncbi:hypothetical protein AAG906_013036 [Vitis piasezkii]
MVENTTSRINVSLISSTSCFDGIISINATAQLPIKLNNNNFPSWKAQFDALLYGYDLMGFLDGTKTCPSKEIIANKLLLHAILASLLEGVVPLILLATSSRDAWVKLHNLYANKSGSRVMNLKEKLTNITCNTVTLRVSSNHQRNCDELALIDTHLSDDDDYFYSQWPWRHSVSFEELHDKLVEHESFLKREESRGGSNVTVNNTRTSLGNTTSIWQWTKKFNNNGNHNNRFHSNVVCQFCRKRASC